MSDAAKKEAAKIKEVHMKLNIHDFRWTREPAAFTVSGDKVEITTRPHTDLWQRTYYKAFSFRTFHSGNFCIDRRKRA